MFKSFYLRSFLKKLAWHVYARSENLHDIHPVTNGEEYFLSKLSLFCREKAFVFFDAGANIGNYSQLLLKHIPDAEGHLFDPLPACGARLRERFGNCPKIVVNETAVSDTAGIRTLWFADPQSTLASFYRRDPASYGVIANTSLEVNMITLEDYIRTHEIAHIHLLKVDVEGHELKALEGLGEFLRPDFIDFIQFEYGGAGIDSMTSLRSLYRLLEPKGFFVCKLMPRGLWKRSYYPVMDNFQYANFVAVSSRF